MKMQGKCCRRSSIKDSVQKMWDTIKDRVIGLHNDHVPTIYTGGWKSNYPHDKEVLDLIREKARYHRFWGARQHGLDNAGVHTNHIIRLETG